MLVFFCEAVKITHEDGVASVRRNGGEAANNASAEAVKNDIDDIFDGGKSEGGINAVNNSVIGLIEFAMLPSDKINHEPFDKFFDQGDREKGGGENCGKISEVGRSGREKLKEALVVNFVTDEGLKNHGDDSGTATPKEDFLTKFFGLGTGIFFVDVS